MTAPSSDEYIKFIHEYRNFIRHHYKTTGDGNYLIEGAFNTRADLNNFLTQLDSIATYKVSEVLDTLI